MEEREKVKTKEGRARQNEMGRKRSEKGREKAKEENIYIDFREKKDTFTRRGEKTRGKKVEIDGSI